jgi:hypothetical protein
MLMSDKQINENNLISFGGIFYETSFYRLLGWLLSG